MTHDEAKMLLQAYIPEAGAGGDPRMAEALELARRDPELAAWFRGQQAVDEAIRGKLQAVRVPVGLAERILAGRPARRPDGWLRYRVPLAWAAALMLLMTLGAVQWGKLRPPATEFAALEAEMAGFLVRFPKLDLTTDQWPDMVGWLARNPALAGVEIPAGLRRFPGLGCREVSWRGRSVMLVCFAAEGEIVHLFVLPRGDLEGAPAAPQPAFDRVNGWSTARWAQGDVAYLTLTQGDPNFLRKLLRGIPKPG